MSLSRVILNIANTYIYWSTDKQVWFWTLLIYILKYRGYSLSTNFELIIHFSMQYYPLSISPPLASYVYRTRIKAEKKGGGKCDSHGSQVQDSAPRGLCGSTEQQYLFWTRDVIVFIIFNITLSKIYWEIELRNCGFMSCILT